MGRPKKYEGLYDRQKEYHSTEKGKTAVKKYRSSESWKKKQRERARIRRGTIIDKKQWFIDNYGDIDRALNLLDDREEEVIVKIYGLDGNLPIKQKQIAEEWGTKPQWISQIKLSAIAKLEKVTKSKHEAIDPQQEKKPPSK